MDKKKDNKRIEKSTIIWSIGITLCLLMFIISMFNVFNKDDESNNNKENNRDENIIYNDNKDVISDKKVRNVEFTNIECSFDGFNSLLTYTITNNGKNSIVLKDYELIVKDKSDNILAIMVPGDTSELKAKESIDIGNAIDINLSKVAKLELRLSK